MLKTNKPWTRALSTALALCMLLSLLPVSVLAVQREATTETQSDAYYSVISQKNYKVSPGITEKEIISTTAQARIRTYAMCWKQI